jgi:hypothetical protein
MRVLLISLISCEKVPRQTGVTAQAAMDAVPLDLILAKQVLAVGIRIHMELRHVAGETFAGGACP